MRGAPPAMQGVASRNVVCGSAGGRCWARAALRRAEQPDYVARRMRIGRFRIAWLLAVSVLPVPALAQANQAIGSSRAAVGTDARFLESTYPAFDTPTSTAGNPPRRPIEWKNRTSRLSDRDKASTVNALDWWKVAVPLVLITGLILLTAGLAKRHGALTGAGLPREAFELIGKQHLDNRQAVLFLRCGARVLIVGSTPNGLHPLSEITDPVEVDLLAGACRANREDRSLAKSFRGMLSRARSGPPASHLSDDASGVLRGPHKSAAPFFVESHQSATANGGGTDV